MFLELNVNENITDQNLWDTMKKALTGKFTALNTHNRKKIIRENKGIWKNKPNSDVGDGAK